MSNDTKDELVVQAGNVTVLTRVGAGMAYRDFPQGATLPDDLSDEDRDRFTRSGAIGKRGEDGSYVVAARPVPGEVEPDEIPGDLLPGGSIEDILAWVGDDLARARVAKDMELAKGLKARAQLIEKLDAVQASEESEPPKVPEFYDERVAPAPAGGVAIPVDDSEVKGKTAAKAPAGRRS